MQPERAAVHGERTGDYLGATAESVNRRRLQCDLSRRDDHDRHAPGAGRLSQRAVPGRRHANRPLPLPGYRRSPAVRKQEAGGRRQ